MILIFWDANFTPGILANCWETRNFSNTWSRNQIGTLPSPETNQDCPEFSTNRIYSMMQHVAIDLCTALIVLTRFICLWGRRKQRLFLIFMMYNLLRGSAESFLYNSYMRSSVTVVKLTRSVPTRLNLPILYSKVSILGLYPCRIYHTVKGKLVDWKD